MNNTPEERFENDGRQSPGEASTIETTTATGDVDAGGIHTVYRFVNKANGAEFPHQQVYHEAPEVQFGDVVEIQTPKSKPDYYSVDSLEEGEITTVYLVRARNSLWKSILLLAILGVSWVIIDYVLKLIF